MSIFLVWPQPLNLPSLWEETKTSDMAYVWKWMLHKDVSYWLLFCQYKRNENVFQNYSVRNEEEKNYNFILLWLYIVKVQAYWSVSLINALILTQLQRNLNLML
jgi:hypothetical protein